MTNKPTLRTALKNAPDDDTREIIKLLRKLKASHKAMQKLITNDNDNNN